MAQSSDDLVLTFTGNEARALRDAAAAHDTSADQLVRDELQELVLAWLPERFQDVAAKERERFPDAFQALADL